MVMMIDDGGLTVELSQIQRRSSRNHVFQNTMIRSRSTSVSVKTRTSDKLIMEILRRKWRKKIDNMCGKSFITP